jgi:hypothetical protein
MGRDQHIIDELKRFERLCLDLADDSAMPEEQPACRSWRTTIAPRSLTASAAIDLPTQCPHRAFSEDWRFRLSL